MNADRGPREVGQEFFLSLSRETERREALDFFRGLSNALGMLFTVFLLFVPVIVYLVWC